MEDIFYYKTVVYLISAKVIGGWLNTKTGTHQKDLYQVIMWLKTP